MQTVNTRRLRHHPTVCVSDTSGKPVWNGNPHDEGFERAVKKELRSVKKQDFRAFPGRSLDIALGKPGI